MAKRATFEDPDDKKPAERRSLYGLKKDMPPCYSTGSKLIDKCIGGGYYLGRCTNWVGDKSTSKTGLVVEAFANFEKTFGDEGLMKYHEAESAFDKSYASRLGFPKRVEMVEWEDEDDKEEKKPSGRERQALDEDAPESVKKAREKKEKEKESKKKSGLTELNTVERLEEEMEKFADEIKKAHAIGGIYALDSLDALSSLDELDRDMSDASYGSGVPKKMSEFFRRLMGTIERNHIHFLVISQVRDDINAKFGRKVKRSGGRALDFYASQVGYLAKIGPIDRTIKGVKRTIGIDIKLHVDKCKVGEPFRECQFPVLFSFGIDDFVANVEWIKHDAPKFYWDDFATQIKSNFDMTIPFAPSVAIIDFGMKLRQENRYDVLAFINNYVDVAYDTIEADFAPTVSKY